MLKETIYQAASIFAALALYAAVEDRVKGGAARLTARGDVWQAGWEAGYDRGFQDGRRPVPMPMPDGPRSLHHH